MPPSNTTVGSAAGRGGAIARCSGHCAPYRERVRTSLAPFLAPEGFEQPGLLSLAKELTVVPESGRAVVRAVSDQRDLLATPYAGRAPARAIEPVLLVPGFLAGDWSLRLMASHPATSRVPHLSLAHPVQRGLHGRQRRAARAPPGGDRDQAREQGAHRRAQPRRDAGPGPRGTAARPGLRGDHDGQPDAGSRHLPPGAAHRRRHAGPAEPGRRAGPDVGGLRRGCVCADVVRGVTDAACCPGST